MPEPREWKTLGRETVLQVDDGKYLTVESHKIELPDGTVIEDWPWLIMPEFVNVVARTAAGEFICFRQTKYACRGVTMAVVGGYLDPAENPLAAAQRELLEETGYRALTWISLGSYAIDGNRGAGRSHLFVADQAVWQQPTTDEDLEDQQLLLLSRAELEQALVGGEFQLVTWSAAVAMAMVVLRD